MQHLLDIMADIPALLARFDQIKNFSLLGNKSPAQIAQLQTGLEALATDIKHGLHQWKSEWADTYPHGQANEVRFAQEDTLPTFQCRDPTTGEIVYPAVFVYPDPVLAQAMCHYYAALMIVFSVDTPPWEDATIHNIYHLACLICRSMDYYIRTTVPVCLTARVGFPFRVAYDGLPEGSTERKYVERVFGLISRVRVSRDFEPILEEVSVRQPSL